MAVRCYVVTEVAGGSFATATRFAAMEAELGADDVSLEIVSGVLVGIGFSVDVETVEQAGKRAEEVLWVSSLERVGPLEIAVPSTV